MTADNFFKSHQKFNGKKSEFDNILVTFGRSPIAVYATYLAPVYFKFNAKSNPYIGLVYRWREGSKTRDFNRNGKIFLKWRIYSSPIVNRLERHFEKACTQYVCWNVKKIGLIAHLRHFRNENIFHRMLVNPLTAVNFFKCHQKFNGYKSEFANILVTFGRSLIANYATYLAPVYFKFNAELNPHIHLVYRWRESRKTRDFNRNGKIFLKWRIYPSPIVNGLERHFEKACTQYVCWNVK